MTDADWAKLGNDFMQRMGLMNHQYIIVKHSGTEKHVEGNEDQLGQLSLNLLESEAAK